MIPILSFVVQANCEPLFFRVTNPFDFSPIKSEIETKEKFAKLIFCHLRHILFFIASFHSQLPIIYINFRFISVLVTVLEKLA